MNEIIQLYKNKEKTIKLYPKTISKEVYMDSVTTVDEAFNDLKNNKVDNLVVENNSLILKANGVSIKTIPMPATTGDILAHTHDNKDVIDLITGDDIQHWNEKSDFSGSYLDLDDKPTLLSMEEVEAYVGDKLNEIDENINEIHGHSNLEALNEITSEKILKWDECTDFDGDYNSLTNKPKIFDGDYNNLTNAPEIFDGNYDNLENKPELFDGDYISLTNKPELFDGIYDSLKNIPTSFPPTEHNHDVEDIEGLSDYLVSEHTHQFIDINGLEDFKNNYDENKTLVDDSISDIEDRVDLIEDGMGRTTKIVEFEIDTWNENSELGVFEIEIAHNLESKNLSMSTYDSDGNFMVVGARSIDDNNLIIYSDIKFEGNVFILIGGSVELLDGTVQREYIDTEILKVKRDLDSLVGTLANSKRTIDFTSSQWIDVEGTDLHEINLTHNLDDEKLDVNVYNLENDLMFVGITITSSALKIQSEVAFSGRVYITSSGSTNDAPSNVTKDYVDAKIEEVQSAVSILSSTISNSTKTIGFESSEWTKESDSKLYKIEVSHNLDNENIDVSAYNSENESMFVGSKAVDNNSVNLYSTTAFTGSVFIVTSGSVLNNTNISRTSYEELTTDSKTLVGAINEINLKLNMILNAAK